MPKRQRLEQVMTLRIAIDTGGTFTDVVAINDETGALHAVKTPSTPGDPSVGLLIGLRKAAEAAGLLLLIKQLEVTHAV